jgi:hypothetical protein
MRKYQLPLKTNACQTLNNSASLPLSSSSTCKDSRVMSNASDFLNESHLSSSNHTNQRPAEGSPPPALRAITNEIFLRQEPSGSALSKTARDNSSVKKGKAKENFVKKSARRSLQKYVVLNLDKDESSSIEAHSSVKDKENITSSLGMKTPSMTTGHIGKTIQEDFLEDRNTAYMLSSPSSPFYQQGSIQINKFISFTKSQMSSSPMRAGSEANTLSRDNHFTPARRRSLKLEEQAFNEPTAEGETSHIDINLIFCVNHPSKRVSSIMNNNDPLEKKKNYCMKKNECYDVL